MLSYVQAEDTCQSVVSIIIVTTFFQVNVLFCLIDSTDNLILEWYTMQSHYDAPHYNANLGITLIALDLQKKTLLFWPIIYFFFM
jgi:hypothetical protein